MCRLILLFLMTHSAAISSHLATQSRFLNDNCWDIRAAQNALTAEFKSELESFKIVVTEINAKPKIKITFENHHSKINELLVKQTFTNYPSVGDCKTYTVKPFRVLNFFIMLYEEGLIPNLLIERLTKENIIKEFRKLEDILMLDPEIEPCFLNINSWEKSSEPNNYATTAVFNSKDETDRYIGFYFKNQGQNPLIIQTSLLCLELDKYLKTYNLATKIDYTRYNMNPMYYSIFKKNLRISKLEYRIQSRHIPQVIKAFYNHKLCPDCVIGFFVKNKCFEEFRSEAQKREDELNAEISQFIDLQSLKITDFQEIS